MSEVDRLNHMADEELMRRYLEEIDRASEQLRAYERTQQRQARLSKAMDARGLG